MHESYSPKMDPKKIYQLIRPPDNVENPENHRQYAIEQLERRLKPFEIDLNTGQNLINPDQLFCPPTEIDDLFVSKLSQTPGL